MNLFCQWMLVVALTTIVCAGGYADSALPLISGFDQQRLEAAYPPRDEQAAGELGKLIFRLRQVNARFLQQRLGKPDEPAPLQLGDVVKVEGVIEAVSSLSVPQKLVEFLEFRRLQLVDIATTDKTRLRVVTTGLPREAQAGDRVGCYGVWIELAEAGQADEGNVAAAARLQWFPASPVDPSWQMLSDEGVDIGLLAGVKDRNLEPLTGADGDAFYTMLAATDALSGRADLPQPVSIQPATLLRESGKLSGQWVRLSLETVQITRVAVTEPQRQQQLGSDHYYQIDAMGDLGNVVVRIDRPEGDQGPPAKFYNRFPVSLVVRRLPDFLSQQIRDKQGGDAIVSE
ncbi:MAG: hypothetical protein MI861_18255, partial [Pirellulales bacterium]|nr:hypothetical protein [Pirellulales bacterium]